MSDQPRDWARDDAEWELRMDQIRADIKLKTTQSAAEWPKVFTAALVAVAALFAAAGTLFGYSLGGHH